MLGCLLVTIVVLGPNDQYTEHNEATEQNEREDENGPLNVMLPPFLPYSLKQMVLEIIELRESILQENGQFYISVKFSDYQLSSVVCNYQRNQSNNVENATVM